MPGTVSHYIVGIDYLRRIHAQIDLVQNCLIVPGTSQPLSLIRESDFANPSNEHEASSITMANPISTKITIKESLSLPGYHRQMVCCMPLAPIREGTHVLVETTIAPEILLVARSLNTVRRGVVWVQVQNPTESKIDWGPQTQIGTATVLPSDYHYGTSIDSTNDDVNPGVPTQTDSIRDPTRTYTDKIPVAFTQQIYPGLIAVVTDTTRTKTTNKGTAVKQEIPINWEGSSLNPLQRETIRQLLLEFDLFVTTSKAPGRTDRIKCTINTGNAAPIKSAPFPVSQREGELMEAEIRQYEELGLIRPSTSPWASPVLMIRKPDGSIRLCIDYRKLNDVTIKDRYPMPRVDDLLDVLGKSKYFSTTDVASGYWNVRMDEDSIPKTAFICKFGLYEWLVMPFGPCNAVPQFERLMEDVLRDQLWQSCLVYLDDVIVFSADFASHLSRLRQVLQCFQDAGLKLKMSKCHWGKTSVTFLGHIVTPAGILPNLEKVKSVLKIRPLRNVAEVRAFLGLAG
ncbi:hypothetical protein Ae201684P_008866 [Aphanomyces euteiches]|uniref:Reverse transcriptase domain-containing protein n=1 Tax=Aphanomyces euteiches TaxID=100861 RepID=A0A6G0XFN8_9STRA|nr:hypothetical protein Ae201684_005509 [Aphanomyces euteiches]KAH9093207.1 hypothetical protein Ae201684P_008866 [Aphanomyces euteiches]KAH9143266.1 hypothetical protein AeRB84_012716 [Aphanomyces euteiches]